MEDSTKRKLHHWLKSHGLYSPWKIIPYQFQILRSKWHGRHVFRGDKFYSPKLKLGVVVVAFIRDNGEERILLNSCNRDCLVRTWYFLDVIEVSNMLNLEKFIELGNQL